MRRRGRAYLYRALLVVLCCSALLVAGIAQARFPQLEAETLANTRVTLPQDAAGKIAILVVTFSRSASAGGKKCSQELTAAFGSDPKVKLYQLAALEEVPRLFRGMVVRSIRKGIPQTMHATFLTVFTNNEILKKQAGFQEDDEPYIVLLDGNGNNVWRTYASCSAQQLTDIKGKIAALTPASN